jgi:hypothetical protein
MKNYYSITVLVYVFVVLAVTACSKKDPEPTKLKGVTGSISHYIDGKLWQNTLTPTGVADISTRKTKGGLELTARNIKGTDTVIAYFFLKDYNGSGRRFIINPQDTAAFPDTISSSFGYFGLQSILKRRQPALTLFGTSGVITIDQIKADSLLYGTYSMEVTINDKQSIITDGSFNGVKVK